MELVAYIGPTPRDRDALPNLRLNALTKGHQVRKVFSQGCSRNEVLKAASRYDGLIVESLAILTGNAESFATAKLFEHLIALQESIDTTELAGQAIWKALKAVAELKTGTKDTPKPRKQKFMETVTSAHGATPSAFIISTEITLERVWRDYRHSRKLAPGTIFNYDKWLKAYLGDWIDKPIALITKDDVEKRHYEITNKSGPYAANSACRFLKSLLNYARHRYETSQGEPIITRNVVSRLSEVRAWNPEVASSRRLDFEDMREWYQALQQIESQIARDYHAFLLFTGARSFSEATALLWEDVDFEKAQVTFRRTKNHRDFTMCVSRHVLGILKRRHAENISGKSHVFWMQNRDGGYWPQNLITKKIEVFTLEVRQKRFESGFSTLKPRGIDVNPHGLRRSFACVADSLGIEFNSIQKMLNHSPPGVTNRNYLPYRPERYRREIEMIGDALERLLGINQAPEIGALEIKSVLTVSE
jgi:integrase